MPKFRFSETTLAYFQFVFAAITPLLFLGSVVGRMNFKVWLIFVPLWSTFAYSVNAFLLWGGGWWAQAGALDYSGGYVIHLAAGTTGFVAAAVIGPRLARDRERAVPNNLPLAAVGAGVLWLGWNGFNGGDPYFSGADASIGGAQHQPHHRRRAAHLGALGHLREQAAQADVPRRDQRHDHRPCRDHPGGRLCQQLRRDDHRRRRLFPGLDVLELARQDEAVPRKSTTR